MKIVAKEVSHKNTEVIILFKADHNHSVSSVKFKWSYQKLCHK